jgi:hypothetical protein
MLPGSPPLVSNLNRVDAYRMIQRRAEELGMNVSPPSRIPRNRHHRLSRRRRHAEKCATDGGARKPAHDEALRPAPATKSHSTKWSGSRSEPQRVFPCPPFFPARRLFAEKFGLWGYPYNLMNGERIRELENFCL